MSSSHQRVLEMALELGFDLAGVAPLAPPARGEAFERWLAAGHHADMDWLERNRERILDPARILPEGKSILVLGMGHARPSVELSGGGKVARYAAGRDYHNRIGKLLGKLQRQLRADGWVERSRGIVDAGPLLERSHAAEAGLGFESKAANLLHRRFGPWFFLAEVLIDRELDVPQTVPVGSCGTCRACIDACPTGAIVAEGVVDARRCLSYHTIENRSVIPRELRPAMEGWVFGCDVCSEVCPWGQDAPDASSAWGTHPAVEEGSLLDWLTLDEASFSACFRGSPLQRPRREGLVRNAALGLAQVPTEAGRDGLLRALEDDPASVVREACAWSLLHAHGQDRGVREAVERALAREDEGSFRILLRQDLERDGDGTCSSG